MQANAGSTPAGAWLAIAGGALMGVGTVLPWLTATAFGISVSRNGLQMGTHDGLTVDGLVILVLGIVTAIIGISRLTRTALPRYLQRSSIVTALVVGVLLFNDWPGLDILVKASHAKAGVLASIGYGFWVCAAGACASLVDGVVLRSAGKQRPTPAVVQP